MATLKAFEPNDLTAQEEYSTIAFEALRKRILARYPHLAKETREQASHEFDRITRKMRRELPFKSWREMDRFANHLHLVPHPETGEEYRPPILRE